MRKKKKRRKRKLPKDGGRAVLGQTGCRARCCETTRPGERSWCASATDHGRCGGDSSCARGADRGVPVPEVFVVPQITEEIVEVTQPGTRLSTCSLLCNDKCWGDRAEICGGSTVAAFSRSSSSWTRLLTLCNVQARGPDCAEFRGDSTVQVQFFQQVHFLSRVIQAGFSALDHQEFLVIEGSGVGADAGLFALPINAI